MKSSWSAATRIPRIVKLVSDFFNGKEPNKSITIHGTGREWEGRED